MHEGGGGDDLAAVDLADGLVAEAHPEDRVLAGQLARSTAMEMPALSGRPGPGEIRMASGAAARMPGDVDGVVAVDDGVGPQLAQLLDEVVDERVVVVDDQHPRPHGRLIVPARAVAVRPAPDRRRDWLSFGHGNQGQDKAGKAHEEGPARRGQGPAPRRTAALGRSTQSNRYTPPIAEER